MPRPRMRLTTVLAVALMFGCSNPTYYQGLGRPAFDPTTRPARLPVSIVEVFVTDPAPANRFALLVNTGTADIATGTLTLTGPGGDVAVGALAAGADLKVSLASLTGTGLLGGELAAKDAAGTVHAYLAWGADPAVKGSVLSGSAYASGATAAGAFVPTGFPPPTNLAFASTAAGVGCVAPSATVAGLATPTTCPVAAGAVALRGIAPALDGGTDSTVTLHNLGTAALDLYGVRLCQGGGCATITTDVIVAAGADQVLHVGAGTAAATDPVIPGVPIAGASELAVLAPGNDLTVAGPTLQAYAHWGSVVTTRFADAATAAGLWPARDAQGNPSAAEGVRVPGEILVPVADSALVAPAWAPAAPEANAATLPIGPTTNLWTTCSAPRRWGPQATPTLVLSAIEAPDAAATHGVRLHFTNRDAGPAVSLSAITVDVVTDDLSTNPSTTTTLALSATVFASDPVTDLAPGATLAVELAAACPLASGTPCLVGPALTARGELVVRVNGAMVQYLASDTTPNQVGAAVPRRTFVTDALAANLWPGARGTAHDRDCAVALPAAGSTLDLDLTLDGRSPPDWQ